MRVYQFRHIRADAQCSRTIFDLRRGLLICGLLGLAWAAPARAGDVEVVVTLKEPPLAHAFAAERTLAFSSFARPNRLLLSAPASRAYLAREVAAQARVQRRITASIPRARVRWSYGIVANGFAVVVPHERLADLSRIRGVARVWPSVRYRPLLDQTPQLIGASTLWGPALANAGQGMKIAVIDDGIDQRHPFFSPVGFTYPAGFPKGQAAYTTPKVIVARAFPPAGNRRAAAALPFEPDRSDHGLHVAGIAAGDNGTVTRSGFRLSGIAPRAYLGNYRAATLPSEFGLNANSPELVAAAEAAVRDGMDVINLSFGEVEVDPARDLVVRALNAAAAAGVVSTVSAGNDFGQFGFGSITSPATAERVIAVASSTGGHGSVETDAATDYSSAGPAPYSLQLKPDVTAPGDSVASAAPNGGFVESSGTSMAAPHVAGAVALLRQRHPTWTPEQIKSALVLTGAPVRLGSREVSPLREGGGRIDLVRADQPLVFVSPSSLSLGLVRPGATVTRTIALTDAGGGAGAWGVDTTAGNVAVPAGVTVPGTLTVRLSLPRTAAERDVSGFIRLNGKGTTLRVPLWFRVERPRLQTERRSTLRRTGIHRGDTRRGVSRVATYRYPEVPTGQESFPAVLTGREVVYRVRMRRSVANFGVAVTSRAAGVRVEPRIVRAGDENRLAGYSALPYDQNPYRSSYGKHRLVAGVVLPGLGVYDIVFDTPRNGRPGAFSFRYWVGDTAPPSVRVLGVRGRFLELAVTDRGSGVDPTALEARVDGLTVPITYAAGRGRISLANVRRGRHTLSVTAADYQETKNMENVARVLPNTRTFRTTFVVR